MRRFSFWETTEWWTDSDEEKRIKRNRRKSNYYYDKVEDIDNLIERLDLKFELLDGYNFDKYIYVPGTSETFQHGYFDTKKVTYADAHKLDTDLREALDALKKIKDVLEERLKNYFRKGNR